MRIVIDLKDPDAVVVESDPAPVSNAPGLPRRLPLAEVSRTLCERLGTRVAGGLVQGKTRLRDELMTLFGCSAVDAERLVDRLVALGHVRFERGDAASDAGWILDPTHRQHSGT
jgi:hypothetical protein